VKVVVNNCGASLDVITFRGVPAGTLRHYAPEIQILDGSEGEWEKRDDGALLGEQFARRRGLRPGDRFDAAGVNVQVDDPKRLEDVARAIDERFAADQFPTSTRAASAFVARAARDVVVLVSFAGIVGWASLAAVFALIANAIALAVRDRVRDHAVLRTLGWTELGIAWIVVLEATLLGLAGGAAGALGALAVLRASHLTFGMEGVSIAVTGEPSTALAGIALATALGAVAGAVPAWGAAHREIVQGFRSA